MKIAKVLSIAYLLILLASCSDPCGDVVCQNHAICVDGSCICIKGYTGVYCEAELRALFLGKWSGTYTCNILAQPDSIVIDIVSDSTNVSAIIFVLNDSEICSTLNEYNEMVYDKTIIDDGDTLDLSGLLKLVDKELIMTLFIDDLNGEPVSCNFAMQK